jgi:myosin heavy subunit
MSAGNNFVDLRITHAGIMGDSEDSVWPAFTDIMTVVLMIFLISLVAFLIRNTQLLDELQTTLIEKDQISVKAYQSEQKNTTLETQLALVRKQILSLETTLQGVSTQKTALEQTLAEREQAARDLEIEIGLLTKLRDQLSDSNSDLLSKLDLSKQQIIQQATNLTDTKNTLNQKISLLLAAKAGLTLERDTTQQSLSEAEARKFELNSQVITMTEQLRLISEKLSTEAKENESLNTELQQRNTLMAGLSTSKEELELKLQEMTEVLRKLENLYASRGAQVSDLQAQLTDDQLQYKSLQEEFDSLDQQYRELIRPARSTAGKYVVDVYFAKQFGQPVYRLREPSKLEPETLTYEALNQKLAALKADKQQALYTKIRIDDQSGVGFNEAWKFTQHILSEYDYYTNDFSATQP